tara:strand:+ start:1858 stop:5604 length:3747 start_codon:yes stop_codon:yes gene_type:complete
MINLSDKFKAAISNDSRTSLYPIVRIYKGVRTDDWSSNSSYDDLADEVINLSIKETSIVNLNGKIDLYKPLLLQIPSIKSKADIINNNYQISSVNLNISNAPYKGAIFSDNINSYIKSVCQIYYSSNGLDNLSDCLLAFTGTIRRFNQKSESLSLTVEDLTQQILQNNIPSTKVPDEPYYNEKTVGTVYPMVYGYVDKSPLISRSLGATDTGNVSLSLDKLHIDRKGVKIGGLMESVNLDAFGHDFINQNHPLIVNGFLKNTGSLSMFVNNNFIPITQDLNVEAWSYEDVEIDLSELYSFEQSDGQETSASIKINPEAFVTQEDISGLPTRIYRPIDKIECQVQSETAGDINSRNRIYGFTGYDKNSDNSGSWQPWQYSQNVVSSSSTSPYDTNWETGDQTWWEPTDCNLSTDSTQTTFIDDNWVIHKPETDGLFPVNHIQDGNSDSGIYLCGKNSEAASHSGWAKIKFIYEDNVGQYPCSTKYIYDAELHSFDGMNDGSHKRVYGAKFWMGSIPTTDFGDGYTDPNTNRASQLAQGQGSYTNNWPNIPSFGNEHSINENVSGGQNGTEETLAMENILEVSTTVNSTQALNSINLGIPQFQSVGTSHNNDAAYAALSLYNFYILQDTIVIESADKDYFVDVAGRVNSEYPIDEELQLGSATHFGLEGIYWWSILTFLEPHNLTGGHNFKLYKSDGTYKGEYTVSQVQSQTEIRISSENLGDCDNGHIVVETFPVIHTAQEICKDIIKKELGYTGEFEDANVSDHWEHSFTLNSQSEAKQILEDLFKSSIVIPTYNSQGQFKFIELHQIIEDENINSVTINNSNILRYSFSLTDIDDVKNQINIKYRINYATGEFDRETGYEVIDADGNPYNTYDEITQGLYPVNGEFWYNIDYYGLNNEEGKLDIEAEYIRDTNTAIKYQKRLLSWYANQHLVIKLTLPVSYMYLEVGDYIRFDELIANKLAFGYDYTKNSNKNGQLIYKHFFIDNIQKSLKDIKISAIQCHRGEFGFYDGWDEDIGSDSDTINNESGTGWQNFEQLEPYDHGELIEESQDDFDFEDEIDFSIGWEYNNNDLNVNPQLIVNTNELGPFNYEVYIIHNDEPFEYGIPQTPSVIPMIPYGTEYSADNYIVSTAVSNSTNQGGKLLLHTDYDIPEGHNGIIGLVRITSHSGDYVAEEVFSQHYVEPFEAELGDVNQDGTINILDVVTMVGFILSGVGAEVDTEQEELADMNNDGIVNILDVIALVNVIVGD